jgi:hypothetical protein
MPSRDLRVSLIGDDRTGTAFSSAAKGAEGLGSKLAGFGKVAALAFGGAAVAGVAGFGAALVQGVRDAASYEQITNQLAQTLKSTGNAAGTSVDGLKAYAGELESLSGVDEELILNSQNVLATFTKVQNQVGKGNNVFDQASLAALNLSTTMGGDLQGATVLVGKALNDPIKGMAALGKAGVALTQGQKDQIKTMVASGDVMGAQKIILGELETQFGGAAKAAGAGLTGSIARAKDAFSDIFRTIATAVLPTLSQFAEFVAGTLMPGLKGIWDLVVGGDFTGALSEAFGWEEDSAVVGFLFSVRDALVQVMGTARQAFDVLFRGDFTGGPFAEDSRFIDVLFRIREAVTQVMGVARQAFDIIFRGDFTGGPLAEDSPFVAGLFTAREQLARVATVITGTIVPAFLAFAGALLTNVIPAITAVATFLQEHQNVAKALGATVGIVAGLVVAAWAYQAAQSTIAAVRSVRAWISVATGAQVAEKGSKKSTAQIVAGWVVQASKATFHAAKIVAGWAATGAAAVLHGIRGMAVATARFVASWVVMSAQALLNAARVAAAWLIAMGPIGLVIAAVVGLVVVVVKNWDTIREKTVALWDKVKQVTAAAWDAIKDAVGKAVDFLVRIFLNFTGPGLIIKHWETIKQATSNAWEAVKQAVSNAVDAVVRAIDGIAAIPGRVGEWFRQAGDAAGAALDGLVDFIRGIPERIFVALAPLGDLVRRVGDWFRAAGGAAGAAFSGLVDFVRGIPGRIFDAIGGLGDLARRVGDWFRSAGGDAGSALSGLVDFVRGIPGRVFDAVGGLSGLAGRVGQWFRDAGGSAGAAMNGLVDFLRGIPRRVLDALGNLGDLLSGVGRSIIDGLIRGIESAFGRVRDTLGRLTGFLPDWKGPASRDASLLYGAGQLVMGGFEKGLRDSFGNVRRALGDATDLIGMDVGGTGYVNARLSASAAGRGGMPLVAPASARNLTVQITGQVERLDEDRLMTLLARAERLAGVG